MDIIIIDEKIKNNLNSMDKKFYFLDTSHIITKYKKILSKPILHSNENKREKSDIIKEYIKIVNFKYKEAFYHKIDILEIVTSKEKPLPPPPSHKIETLKEYREIVKKLKKAAKKLKKDAKTKKILISNENDVSLHSEDKYFEKDKYHYSIIDVDEILYYKSESNKMICKNCNGINLTKTDDFITCEDCFHLTERILNLFSYSDLKNVNHRRISKLKKKIENSYNKDE